MRNLQGLGRSLAVSCAVALLVITGAAWAAQQYQSNDDSSSIGSVVVQCLNAQGKAVPMTAAGQCLGSGGGGGSTTGFTPNGTYGSLTATASTSASTALPATSATVRLTNLGSGTVSCTFATGAATGLVNNAIIGPLSSISRVIGTYDHVACIDQTGSTGSQLVILEGGSGLGNDTGGGGGGGGGAITAAASAIAAGAGVDGWDLTQGTKADTAYSGSGSGSVVAILKWMGATLNSMLTAIQSAIPSQSPAVPIGGMGICDGANGTTNPCTNAATVKGASTAPGATDKALVAALSPNTGEVGTPQTSVSQPTGGVGLSGWLSGIYNKLITSIAVVPSAQEVHLGEVGGNQIRVDVAQTVTASSAYASGNAIGGKMTIAGAARVSGSLGAGGTGGILQQVVANSKSVQTAQVDVFLFNSDPSSSTCTDKTAFVLATADFDKVIGVASIPGTAANNSGWFSGGTGSVGQANNLAMAYDLSSATTIYACAVTRGTPTFTATSDISFKYQFLRN